ncbi:hypothetical protein B6K86_05705 [Lachnospiraceae bacterium]|nr:hypothetical protein B6K86_05705 [Lachnospiraceae bacterium]
MRSSCKACLRPWSRRIERRAQWGSLRNHQGITAAEPKKRTDWGWEERSMKFCENCGAALQENENFCPGCGAKVKKEETKALSSVQTKEEPTSEAAPPQEGSATEHKEGSMAAAPSGSYGGDRSGSYGTPPPQEGSATEHKEGNMAAAPSGSCGGYQSGSYGTPPPQEGSATEHKEGSMAAAPTGGYQSGSYGGDRSGSYGAQGGYTAPNSAPTGSYGGGINPTKSRRIPGAAIAGGLAALLLLLLAVVLLPKLGKKRSGMEGTYYLSSMTSGGETTEMADILDAMETDENPAYIRFDQDGKGVIDFFDEKTEFEWGKKELKLEDGSSLTYQYDAKAESIELDYGEGKLLFVRSGQEKGGLPGASSAKKKMEGTEAEAGEALSTEAAEYGYSEPLPYPSRWYGYARYTNFRGTEDQGNQEELYDIWAEIGYNGEDPYFEIYDIPDHNEDTAPLLSMWLQEDEHMLRPTIGEEDAWLFDQYLTEEEEFDLLTSYHDGSLRICCQYGDEENGFDCEFFIREEGSAWDEQRDTLPPGYEQYH